MSLSRHSWHRLMWRRRTPGKQTTPPPPPTLKKKKMPWKKSNTAWLVTQRRNRGKNSCVLFALLLQYSSSRLVTDSVLFCFVVYVYVCACVYIVCIIVSCVLCVLCIVYCVLLILYHTINTVCVTNPMTFDLRWEYRSHEKSKTKIQHRNAFTAGS